MYFLYWYAVAKHSSIPQLLVEWQIPFVNLLLGRSCLKQNIISLLVITKSLCWTSIWQHIQNTCTTLLQCTHPFSSPSNCPHAFTEPWQVLTQTWMVSAGPVFPAGGWMDPVLSQSFNLLPQLLMWLLKIMLFLQLKKRKRVHIKTTWGDYVYLAPTHPQGMTGQKLVSLSCFHFTPSSWASLDFLCF